MIHVECPWCDGPAVVDAGAAEVRCEGCAVAVEIAPDIAAESIGLAA
jgi:hypothetical protein